MLGAENDVPWTLERVTRTGKGEGAATEPESERLPLSAARNEKRGALQLQDPIQVSSAALKINVDG